MTNLNIYLVDEVPYETHVRETMTEVLGTTEFTYEVSNNLPATGIKPVVRESLEKAQRNNPNSVYLIVRH